MNIVIAMDSLKGSLSSLEAGEAIRTAAEACGFSATVLPMADGGEGTADALVSGLGGHWQSVEVTGPLGAPVTARYGILPQEHLAVIEMASAAGLPLVPKDRRDPRRTTTYGLGQMILDAWDRGCRSFLIGIGGSATNDGGLGMLTALGYRFLDETGRPAGIYGGDVASVRAIDDGGVHPAVRQGTFNIACDVTNPLCGPNGASAIFGPQKGATPAIVVELDTALLAYSRLAAQFFGQDLSTLPGAGAAGGLGFAFAAFLHANLQPGAELVIEAMGLEQALSRADLVVTGEGRLDGQSAMGKTPCAIAAQAKRHGLPVIAFAGSVTADAAACHDAGIDAYFPIVRGPITLDEAMDPDTARAGLTGAAEEVFRLLRRFGRT